MHAEGRIRAIGVAGLGLAELRRLIDETGTVPAVHQIELNPWQQQVPLREFHGRHGILTGAARPFGRGTPADETVTSLAAKYGKTPAQIVLRWHLQTGALPVPKSLVPARIRENFAVFDFELADDDLTVLAELDTA
jgi:diketogulonate reductase-like aldo/keto reductase